MNRVKIELPSTLPFSTIIDVRITDINYGNHLGNHVFLELIHEARVRFLSCLGYTELRFDEDALIMGDAAIEFKAEIFYGDIVEVQVGAGSFSRVGFDLVYLISVRRSDQFFIAAKAKTGMICYNYHSKKVTALSAIAREKLQPYSV